MTRACRRAGSGMALALSLLALLPSPPRAQTPSSEEIAHLAEALNRAKVLRVRTRAGSFIERRVGLGREGVRLAGDAQYGATVLTPPQPSLVPWDFVSGIEFRRGYSDRGLLIGAAVGFCLGAIWASRPLDAREAGDRSGHLFTPLIGAACGAAAGSVVGTACDPWVRAWPEAR